MSHTLRTEIAGCFLQKLLESEGMLDSNSNIKDIKQDAAAMAEVLYVYTQAVMDKFEPPVMAPHNPGTITLMDRRPA